MSSRVKKTIFTHRFNEAFELLVNKDKSITDEQTKFVEYDVQFPTLEKEKEAETVTDIGKSFISNTKEKVKKEEQTNMYIMTEMDKRTIERLLKNYKQIKDQTYDNISMEDLNQAIQGSTISQNQGSGKFANLNKSSDIQNLGQSGGPQGKKSLINTLTGLGKKKDEQIQRVKEEISFLKTQHRNTVQKIEDILEARSIVRKNQFLQSYGHTIELPTFYRIDNKFFTYQGESYVLQLAKFLLPQQSIYVQTHGVEQPHKEPKQLANIYGDYSNSLMLRLIKRHKNHLQMMKTRIIEEFTSGQIIVSDELNDDGLIRTHQEPIVALHLKTYKKEKIFTISIKDLVEKMDLQDENPFKEQWSSDKSTHSRLKKIQFNEYSNDFIVATTAMSDCIMFIPISGDNTKPVQQFESVFIKDQFEFICDVQMQLNAYQNNYSLWVLCKVKGSNKLKLYMEKLQSKKLLSGMQSPSSQESQMEWVFNFQNEITPDAIVKFDIENRCVILCNGGEQLLYIFNHDSKFIQKTVINNKDDDRIVRFVKSIKNPSSQYRGFLIATSKVYDNNIVLIHSHKQDFQVEISKNIGPDSLEVFDLAIEHDFEKGADSATFAINYDGVFQTVTEKYKFDDYKRMIVSEDIVEDDKCMQLTAQEPLAINWPFFAFLGLTMNEVYIYDSFDSRKKYHRVLIPQLENMGVDQVTITNMVITDSYHLFITIEFEDSQGQKNFKLMMLQLQHELEPNQQYQFQNIYEYQDSLDLFGIHVRGENFDEHQNLQVFFHHKEELKMWQKQIGEEVSHIEKVSDISSSFLCPIDENRFVFQCEEDQKEQIKLVEILSSDYETSVIFEQQSFLSKILQINVDPKDMMMIIISEFMEDDNTPQTEFILFCLNTKKVIYKLILKNPDLINRFVMGIYRFISGHIYFDNNIIKLRMDLIMNDKEILYPEHKIFDHYTNILVLEDDQRVRTNSPFNNSKMHRLAYTIDDRKQSNCQKVICVPYLHERKVHLHPIKSHSNYFFTSFISKKNITLIASSNFQDQQIRIYSQNGVQRNRIQYDDKSLKYGKPVAVSNNGLKYLFLNKEQQKMSLAEKMQSIIRGNWGHNYVLSVLELDENDLSYVCQFDIVKMINKYYEELEKQPVYPDAKGKTKVNDNYDRMHEENSMPPSRNSSEVTDNSSMHQLKGAPKWLKNIGQAKFEFRINDNLDVFVRICKNDDVKFTSNNQGCDVINFFRKHMASDYGTESFQTPLSQKLKQNVPGREILEYVFIDQENQFCNHQVKMDQDFIYFYDRNKIKYVKINDLDYNFGLEDLKNDIKLTIEDDELDQLYIKDIKCSLRNSHDQAKDYTTSSQNRELAIVVNQTSETDTVIFWDIDKDQEIEVFDVGKQYQILMDQRHEPFITTSEKTIFVKKRCSLKVFDPPENFGKSTNNNDQQINMSYGCRFDGNNHQWFLQAGHLNLGFSYMTFVMQHQIEKDGSMHTESKEFDLEPFNYIFMKRNYLYDHQDIIKSNHKKLEEVLTSFEQIDETYLEILHYTQRYENDKDCEEVNNSPLHIAFRSGNKRSVDILTSFMAKINSNNSSQFKDLFIGLIEYDSFNDYLENLPVQTEQMKNKLVLRTNEAYDDLIVSMAPYHSVFFNNSFYQDNMKEQPRGDGVKSYPVEIRGLKVGWLIKEDIGREFLKALLKSENLEMYNNTFLQIIIEYLYIQSRNSVCRYLLPFYAVKIIATQVGVILREYLYDLETDFKTWDEAQLTNEKYEDHLIYGWYVLHLCGYICFFCQCLTFLTVIVKFSNKGIMQFLTSSYCIVEMISLFSGIKLATSWIMRDRTHTDATIRYNSLITLFIFYYQSLYYLKLGDTYAPLIKIAYRICYDIRPFLLVSMLVGVIFTNGFYLMGQEQYYFMYLSSDFSDEELESKMPPYRSLLGASWSMYNLMLGEYSPEAFFVGSSLHQFVTVSLFIISSFIILIHMLNMIIAIMGDTFAAQSEVAAQIRIRDHLEFFIENCWLYEWLLTKGFYPEQQRYLIAAYHHNVERGDIEILNKLEKQSNDMSTVITNLPSHLVAISHHDKNQNSYLKRIYDQVNRSEQIMQEFYKRQLEENERIVKLQAENNDQINQMAKPCMQVNSPTDLTTFVINSRSFNDKMSYNQKQQNLKSQTTPRDHSKSPGRRQRVNTNQDSDEVSQLERMTPDDECTAQELPSDQSFRLDLDKSNRM